MGRKKKQTEKEYIWCYYCDKEFDNENTLVSHQVSRHFKCEECGKKLGTLRGLVCHSKTNHNKDLAEVPHALDGRRSVASDIHGMSGIPETAIFEYKVKKAKLLGLPIPKREVAVFRNPQKEFEARMEESRTQTQMADSIASMTVPADPTVPAPMANPFMSTMPPPLQPPMPNAMYGMYPPMPMGVPPMAPMAPMPPMAPMAPMPPIAPMAPMAPMPPIAPMTPMTPMTQIPSQSAPSLFLPTPIASVPSLPVQTPMPQAIDSKTTHLVYTRTDISMEEWKATMPQYHYQDFITMATTPS